MTKILPLSRPKLSLFFNKLLPHESAAGLVVASSHPQSLAVLSLISYCAALTYGTCTRLLVLLLVRPFCRASSNSSSRRRSSSSSSLSPPLLSTSTPSSKSLLFPLSPPPSPIAGFPTWFSEGMGYPDHDKKTTMLRRYLRPTRRRRTLFWFAPPTWLLVLLGLFAAEAFLHSQAWAVPRPSEPEDRPFYTSCQEPNVSAPRENAVLVMLARNEELHKAKHSIDSVERHFNRWFNYPVVFLNDEPWDDDFVEVLNASVSGGATFEVIPNGKWGFPDWMDATAARASIAEQGAEGIKYAGKETYHHMCRFFSG